MAGYLQDPGKAPARRYDHPDQRPGQDDIQLHWGVKQADGSWIARPAAEEDAFALLDRVGRVPLPPYIRKGEMVEADREHYQTVYAQLPGAVAAPTAGLHFTNRLLRRLVEQGSTFVRLTLHVGPGTFRPIASRHVGRTPHACRMGTA